MNYDIHIENLGAIEEADITITPLTIFAGENGTGKSFVTKFFYSVFNSLVKNVYVIGVSSTSVKIHNTINNLLRKEIFLNDENLFLEVFKETITETFPFSSQASFGISSYAPDEIVKQISDHLDYFKRNILTKLEKSDDLNIDKDGQHLLFSFYDLYENIATDTELLLYYLKNPHESYVNFLKDEVINQLKENFQISELKHLIKFNSNYCSFSIKNILSINIFSNNKIEIDLVSFPSFANLLFFESPVYWKLLSIIPDKRLGLGFPGYIKNKNMFKETLTGVPQHFIDLKDLIFANFKDGERPEFIIKCANDLEKQLKGKFKATNDDLIFENNKGQSISKSLVSFGMTNIGIFQAVLSKNIINKGSFVFIDEPESNLHPEWQAILANVLVELAKNGVYIIVTTHSSDMLKAFDISTREQEIDEELSTYYFKSDGKLLSMTDDKFSPIEMARRKLLETYEELMMRGYFL